MPAAYRSIYVTFEANTQKLGTALKQIDNEASSVDRNLKEINKGLKLDPGNAELVARKFNTLSEGIDTARKRLDMLKEAKKQADEQLASTDSSTQQYKDLEAQIASLDKEIERSSQKLANYQTEIKETATSMMNDVKSSATELGKVLAGTATAIGAVVTALGGITMSSATAVDDLNTLSKITGVSVESLQKFQYASKLIDVSQETLSQSLRKLTMNMQSAESGAGKAAEAFEQLGVRYKKADGSFRDSEDVFSDLIDALHEVDDEAQRDAYAMNIFGRSAMELNPLILAGSKALEDYGKEAEQLGLVFGSDTLDGLQEFQDEIDIAKRKLEGAKILVGSEMVSAFEKLTGGVDDLLKMVQQAKADGTLKAIAEDVAIAVSTLINLLSSAAKMVYQFRVEIAAGVTALVTFKTAIAIGKFIESVVIAVGSLTLALQGYTTVQTAANAAAMVNPYVALAAGIAAVTAAIVVYNVKAEEAAQITGKASAEAEEYAKASKEIVDNAKAAAQAHQDTVDGIENERTQYIGLLDSIEQLASKEKLTNAEQRELSANIDELNSKIPGLNLSFNSTTGELSRQREELEHIIDAYYDYIDVQARTEYGIELAKQEITLQQEASKASEEYARSRSKLADAENKRAEAQKRFAEASAKLDKASPTDYKAASDEFEAAEKAVRDTEQAYQDALASATEYSSALWGANDALKENQRLQEENRKTLSEESEELDNLDDATKKLIEDTDKAIDEQVDYNEALKQAQTATGSYKSALKDLLGILAQVQQGTAYSTSQMLDLIEKYPELINYIHQTADGYTLEAEAVQRLAEVRAENTLKSMQAEIKALEAQMSAAAHSGDKETFETLRQQYALAQEQKSAYSSILADIQNGTIYTKSNTSGSSSSSSSGSSSGGTSSTSTTSADDWLKERKAQAKAEEAELENQYKTEKISAEEYYNGLMDIAERYYAGIGELREEYLSAESKVYEGLKKAQEDELSNAKKLTEQLKTVKEAEDALNNARNQEVSVFSAAAGFHAEENTAAIEKAQSALSDKSLTLAETLLKNAKFSGQSLAERLQSIGLSQIRDMLPDLSGLTLPSLSGGGGTSTTTSTRNITYNGGDINITIQGSVDPQTLPELKTTVEDAVRKTIDAMLDETNAERQTGGI